MSDACVVAGDYHTAKFVCPTGMKPWTDDTQSKGDFVTRTWTIDNVSDTTTTDSPVARSLGFKFNAPSIVCFSPSGETFTNGVTYAMGTPDAQQTWLGQIEQWMDDPLFKQEDYCDDDNDLETDMPDWSLCQNIPPQVEARITVPNNGGWGGGESAPGLPSDATDITTAMGPPAAVGDNGAAYPQGTVGTAWYKYLSCP